ncbi:MAG: sigma-54-dependent Fis family transcriptional regulator [SAR324 cluster bacterium]|nr:sigma-54-dependent Fis family transcriptional regulator [SAR324 cluster bacterium]
MSENQKVKQYMEHSIQILIVDDEQSIRWVLEQTLSQLGYSLHLAASAEEAKAIIDSNAIDIAFIDINLPGQDGLSFMEDTLKQCPDLLAIVVTGQSTMYNTITAMKMGAYDYLAKPFDIEDVEGLVEQAAQVIGNSRHSSKSTSSSKRDTGESLVGNTKVMHSLYKAIGRVAPTDLTVLILGESGTGKELIARSIQQHSARGDQPFIALNCAAIPSELLESELFGHEKGAFTGAVERKKGKLELANSGTLFLDEIGDMPLKLQSKLLRVLQEKTFERVGGHEVIETNMRVIAATHQNLEQRIEEGLFRTDLYYRLNVFSVYIPPLRERRDDIPLLVEHFLRKGAHELAICNKRVASDAMEELKRYHWPGNVRELENVIKSLMITNVTETITIDSIPHNIIQHQPHVEEGETLLEDMIYQHITHVVEEYVKQGGEALMDLIIPQVERPLLKLTLEQTKWNQNRSAKILGINRNTLRKKIEILGLQKNEEPGQNH